MRIEKCEKIFLSQNEANTWTKFEQILESLGKGCEDPNTLSLVARIQDLLNDLWEEVEDID